MKAKRRRDVLSRSIDVAVGNLIAEIRMRMLSSYRESGDFILYGRIPSLSFNSVVYVTPLEGISIRRIEAVVKKSKQRSPCEKEVVCVALLADPIELSGRAIEE